MHATQQGPWTALVTSGHSARAGGGGGAHLSPGSRRIKVTQKVMAMMYSRAQWTNGSARSAEACMGAHCRVAAVGPLDPDQMQIASVWADLGASRPAGGCTRTAPGKAPARPMTHLPHVLCSGKLQRGCQDALDVCP